MVSDKMLALGTNRSMIREISEYGARKAKIIGAENVFDYSIGNPSIPAPPEVEQAVHEILREMDSVKVHSYAPAVGEPETREAIARDLNNRFDAGARAEDIFVCCGSSPALIAILSALNVSPESEVVAIAPYFPEYRPYTEVTGSRFVVVPADTEHFQINMAALEASLSPNTQVVIVNSPNNPAGTVYTAETIRTLGQLLTRKGEEYGHPIYILSDEPYRELVYDGAAAPFIPSIYPHTIISYSYSKSLSLPGERVGYIYVPRQAADSRQVFDAINGAARANGHVCAPSLWQKVLVRCAHLGPDVAAYDRNRRALYDGLTEMGYHVAKPDGAFYLFIRVPDGDDEAFCRAAMEENVLLVPGYCFGCPGWARACYCVSYDTILRSLPAFRRILDRY